MKNNTTPTEGKNSEKTLASAGLPDTACSPVVVLKLPAMIDEDGNEYVMHPRLGKIVRTEAMNRHRVSFHPLKPSGNQRQATHGL